MKYQNAISAEINFAPAGHTGENFPETAEFDIFESTILHKIILCCNFVILSAVNFKN